MKFNFVEYLNICTEYIMEFQEKNFEFKKCCKYFTNTQCVFNTMLHLSICEIQNIWTNSKFYLNTEKFSALSEISKKTLKIIKENAIMPICISNILYVYKLCKKVLIINIEKIDCTSEEKIELMRCIENFFDDLEIEMCNEWSKDNESEVKFTALSDITSAFISIHDENGYIYANKSLENYTGYTFEELKHKSFKDIFHPDYWNMIDNSNLLKYKKIRDVYSREARIIDKTGQVKWVELNKGTIKIGDKWCILGISFDINNRKNIELELKESAERLHQSREYDRIKTEFFANISHELRTPLNVILGIVQLLDMMEKNHIKNYDKNKMIEYKEIIRQNCFRLVRLVNNMIDITKIDAGYFKVDLINHNIVSVVEDIVMSVVQYIESKGLSIIFDTEIEEKYIACDPDKIERIMLNLLSNAIKFTERGGHITVNIYDRVDKVLISVKDSGTGIPEDKLRTIFDRFSQVDKSLSRNKQGSGIGLSLVKSLVEMHGGKVVVKSKEGIGTEFLIELPVVETENFNENNKYIENDKIERINIEFSDIYA